MDLSSLTAEEKQLLLAALQEGQPSDMNQDLQLIQPLVQMVQMLKEKTDYLEKLVVDELIGGITSLYNEQERDFSIKDLSNKYGEKFGPYKDFYQELSGSDLYEKLYEELNERKSANPEWSDEAEMSVIDELVSSLKGKFDKIKGPAPVASVEVIEARPVEDESKNKLIDKVRKMRNAAGDINI